MAAIAKFLSDDHHPIEIAFYRNLMVFIGFIIFLAFSGKWHLVKTKRPQAHLARGFVGTLGLICGFWSVSLLPLATATTLFYTAPLLVTILSIPMLGERVGIPRYVAIFIGFLGVVLVVKPNGQELVILGLFFAFFDVVFSALTQIFLRDLGRTENHLTTVFYYMGIGVVVSGLLMPFVWTDIPKVENILLFIGLGLTGGIQQIAKTKGYSLAPISVTGPINYTGIIWAAIFGWVFWDTLPTWSVILGALIIILSNIFILWRENRKNNNV